MPRARFLALLLGATFAVSGILVLVMMLRLFQPPDLYRRDFTQDWLWGRAAADGINPYQPTEVLATRYLGDIPVAVFRHATPQPPTMGLVLLPLAAFDLATASFIWLGVELILLAAFVAVLARWWRLPKPWLLAPAVALMLVSWVPLTGELANGQVTIAMLLLVTLSQYALAARRSFLSGALLGLSLCLKPVAIPIALVYLAVRDLRALVGLAVPPLVALGLVGALIGPQGLGSYLGVVTGVNADYRAAVNNISAWTLGRKLFEGTGSTAVIGVTAPPLVPLPAAEMATTVVVIAGLALLALYVVRRAPRPEAAYGTLCCLSVLLSPIAWDHYLVLALLPMAWVLRFLVQRRFPRRETLLALGAGLSLLVPVILWVSLAELLAGQSVPPGQEAFLPFLPTTVTLAPTIALAVLTALALRVDLAEARDAKLPVPSQRPVGAASAASDGDLDG